MRGQVADVTVFAKEAQQYAHPRLSVTLALGVIVQERLAFAPEPLQEFMELSLQGLRERFHQSLILMRHYAFLVHLTTDLQRLVSVLEQADPNLAETARKRLDEILELPLTSWKEEVGKLMRKRRLEAEEGGAEIISTRANQRRQAEKNRRTSRRG